MASYNQAHISASSYNNGASVHGEWGIPIFKHQKTISMNWTTEEHAFLVDYLAQDSSVFDYANIAVLLKTKTVRDVALRCRWIARTGVTHSTLQKKGISKRWKDDLSVRNSKERRENFIHSTVRPSRLSIQSGASQAAGNIPENDLAGATKQLLLENALALKQISKNHSTLQLRQNIGLLSQARENISKILTNLAEMGPAMKKMAELPKLDEELANSILSSPNFPIQL
ncbi:uncharacterized protein LOC125185106 isoform X2 [Salvia hispanica]|uniref:uncharacterized protein LOC125185106 isoform X2 n=1 Tax=Salvia hispanica TaxID=49212 RepID=UPI002008F36C|nr:uncharacterized protein LOC125185106 isoform X2 [Salvia hispanica]